MTLAFDTPSLTGVHGDDPANPTPRDPYVPASPNIATKLILPGPKMQVRHEISVGDRRYRLQGMFVIDIEYLAEGGVFASHRSLPVDGYGGDQVAALAAFYEAFDFQWRHLVEVDEETLTEGGVRRRRAMEQAVASFENRNA